MLQVRWLRDRQEINEALREQSDRKRDHFISCSASGEDSRRRGVFPFGLDRGERSVRYLGQN